MIKVKYVILGAGPSGLSLANRLLELGEESFIVLERENQAGGLCRSKEVDGSPLDIGGGHFLDVRAKQVLKFVFKFMPESEWQQFDRKSKIQLDNYEINYPYEANIWQMPVDEQVKHLISIMNAGCNQGKDMPAKFTKWITWKLGDIIAENYMLPYNRKIFAPHLDELGTYWLYKLPNVSFEDTLRSCLMHQPQGNLPAHAQFLYPKKYGYGELFLRMADNLGDRLLLNTPLQSFDVESLTINHTFQADMVISTIPWSEFLGKSTIPASIRASINQLKYTSVDIEYFPERADTDSHWTYFPSSSLSYHRVLYRHNFLHGAKGYWKEINPANRKVGGGAVHHNEYAYPLNTRNKPSQIKKILEWASQRHIIGLGRWGEWEHMNSDVAITKSLKLAEELTR